MHFSFYLDFIQLSTGGNARNLAEAAVEKGKPARRNNEEVDVDVSEMAV